MHASGTWQSGETPQGSVGSGREWIDEVVERWRDGGAVVERWWGVYWAQCLSNTALVDGREVSVGSVGSVGTNHLMATNDYSRVDMKMWLVAGADIVVVESST